MLRPVNLAAYLSEERGRTGKVAARAGVSAAFVSQIANGGRGVPAERAADIERACDGLVRRWDLRPGDWHRIWPELIGAEGAPAVPAENASAENASARPDGAAEAPAMRLADASAR